MVLTKRELVFAHERDAAWIMALWKAIHGGDGGPEEIAANVVAAMAPYLAGVGKGLRTEQFEAGFAKLGVQVNQPQVEIEEITQPRQPRIYCFKFQGETICFPLPQLTHVTEFE